MVWLDDQQQATAEAIISIFETGTPWGDYSKVTNVPGDPGGLSYGKLQATIASGNLFLLIRSYCQRKDALHASALKLYLPALARRDPSLGIDRSLPVLLAEAGNDPVMQEEQDSFYERVFWKPARISANHLKVATPFSLLVILDSRVHGSWHRMRNLTAERYGEASTIGERVFIAHYLEERRRWLKTHDNLLLRKSAFRIESLIDVAKSDKWDLQLPIRLRGWWLDGETLLLNAPERHSVEQDEQRLLMLENPFQTGEEILSLQSRLRNLGQNLRVDGIFGYETAANVRRFQQRNGLVADGIVGPMTRAKLGLGADKQPVNDRFSDTARYYRDSLVTEFNAQAIAG